MSLIQWADPSDGCDIICRLGEWKIENLPPVFYRVNSKMYHVRNSFVRMGGRKTEGLNGCLENYKWEIK